MKRITLCKKLNAHFRKLRSVVRFRPKDIASGRYVEVYIDNIHIVETSAFSLTDAFYDDLKLALLAVGILQDAELNFNNSGTLFWIIMGENNILQ